MKKFFSSIFRSKKRSARQSTGLSDLMSFLETKVFPCSECGHFYQLDQPEPLSIATCSQCGAGNFVPRKLGPFWLYKFCAHGGMGRVYKASCSETPGVEYAVKILPQEMRGNDEPQESLRREAEVTLLFNDHPNSVTIVECDSDDGLLYMATEFIDGLTLEQLIEEKGKLMELEAVSLCFQLAQIIGAIHAKGYLYRDLKPQNIIIDKNHKLVLMDYGICLPKGLVAGPCSDEEADGSPHYLPPERITDEGEDFRSEIYSIGMLMYYMLTGKTYFTGASRQEIAERHVDPKRKENLAAEMPLVSEDVVNLIERMTKCEKRKRVQTLAEVQAVINYTGKKLGIFENEEFTKGVAAKL
jgi:eukaryotic-like serine/threonine-protein kinase